MFRVAALACAGLVACGDNALPDGVALAASHDLVVVAHQDDDLLFMQPDVIEAVQRGKGVTIVYTTAGNGENGVAAANQRYAGLRSAYGEAAGHDDWDCGWIMVADHAAQHCRLADGNVSLVFLGYPDGGKEGEYAHSLLKLWEGQIGSAETIAERTTVYTQDALIETLAEIIRETRPSVLRTLEIASTHGRDHSDHMIVGALAVLASARADSSAELVSYRANKMEPVYAKVFPVLARYEACVAGCAPCGEACTTIDPTHVTWEHRRYAVGFRRMAGGALSDGTRCVTADDEGAIALGDCATAPVWTFDHTGQLRVGTRCLEVGTTGELDAGGCIGGAARRFFIDDEGHIWTGLPPTPVAGMDYAHLWCLTSTAGQVRAALCGSDAAQTWTLAPPMVATPRATIGFGETGRAVRLGDLTGDGKADLCAMDSAGLLCAAGDGTGGFAAATRIDSAAAPLAIDPSSLVIGDVDGDGLADACGRDETGVLCATAASGFAAQRWTTAFSDADARTCTSVSLAAVAIGGSVNICGFADEGVICAPYGATFALRSTWPDPSAVVWSAELDGDQQADWCAATATGPACGVDAERDVTTGGVPWGFSQAGVVETVAPDPAMTELADVDGDGRDDLCSLQGDAIACARSQGRGFGPRTTLAVLPGGTALWLGDLDGDGKADACVDAGAMIECAISP